jgi:putative redox protein
MGEISIRWIEDKMMSASDSNGHSIVVGRSPDPQYAWIGVKPSDLLLMAAGSCAAYDVVSILKKQREPLRDLKVICSGEQMEEPPYKFTSIHLHFIISGGVSEEKVLKAIRLSEDKYCSVTNTLKPGVSISSDFEVKE